MRLVDGSMCKRPIGIGCCSNPPRLDLHVLQINALATTEGVTGGDSGFGIDPRGDLAQLTGLGTV